MWVHSPEEMRAPKFPGKEDSPFEPVILKWDGKKFLIKKGINEIPEMIGQAYFLWGLPKALEESDEHFKKAVKVALQRWGVVLKTDPPPPEFLTKFLLAETRENLESMLSQQQKEKEQEN